jgi:hypothetical protein
LGRACWLCPGISDINLFRYCQCVIKRYRGAKQTWQLSADLRK